MASNTVKTAALALALSAAAATAQAGSVEDGFRSFFDGLRAKGQALQLGGPVGAREITTQPTMAKRTDALPLGRNQYALFVADGCRSCPALAERLTKKSRGTVEVLNISRSATARDAFALSKAQGVPAMLVGNYVMSGYSDKLYEQALAQSMNDWAQSMRGQGN